ncbi:hypothetical protein V1477_006892 [Vespula maculifrons]|uniref:Uncharacterized protein n=1 Tax=Vespula maculifrons TaxID=7453 RepID=A0ABD2CGZ6_VESMC
MYLQKPKGLSKFHKTTARYLRSLTIQKIIHLFQVVQNQDVKEMKYLNANANLRRERRNRSIWISDLDDVETVAFRYKC